MELRKEIKDILLYSMYTTFTENDLDKLTDTILEKIVDSLPKNHKLEDFENGNSFCLTCDADKCFWNNCLSEIKEKLR